MGPQNKKHLRMIAIFAHLANTCRQQRRTKCNIWGQILLSQIGRQAAIFYFITQFYDYFMRWLFLFWDAVISRLYEHFLISDIQPINTSSAKTMKNQAFAVGRSYFYSDGLQTVNQFKCNNSNYCYYVDDESSAVLFKNF